MRSDHFGDDVKTHSAKKVKLHHRKNDNTWCLPVVIYPHLACREVHHEGINRGNPDPSLFLRLRPFALDNAVGVAHGLADLLDWIDISDWRYGGLRCEFAVHRWIRNNYCLCRSGYR